MKRFFAAVLCLAFSGTVAATDIQMSMSVEEAYSAIPHDRTRFLRDVSRSHPDDAAYLDRLFTLVDLAVVERVQTLLWITTGGQRGADYRGNYQRLLEELSALEAPAKLQAVHRLIAEAVQEQHKYFEQWRAKGGHFNAGHRLVRNSHQKLIQAYQLLMKTYPDEAAHNRKAFFNHLCALDFI